MKDRLRAKDYPNGRMMVKYNDKMRLNSVKDEVGQGGAVVGDKTVSTRAVAPGYPQVKGGLSTYEQDIESTNKTNQENQRTVTLRVALVTHRERAAKCAKSNIRLSTVVLVEVQVVGQRLGFQSEFRENVSTTAMKNIEESALMNIIECNVQHDGREETNYDELVIPTRRRQGSDGDDERSAVKAIMVAVEGSWGSKWGKGRKKESGGSHVRFGFYPKSSGPDPDLQ
ncbi:hypothetical protein BDZ89DRAFT_1038525 [Hymenopellis radicata]|nr:hypothetical protein BDZ89DRAFT_1038525 [Hymenopellis radicata]